MFSLLYPNLCIEKTTKETVLFPNELVRDLGLDCLWGRNATNCIEYFTDDCEVIQYRNALFDDILRCDDIFSIFAKCAEYLDSIAELRKNKTIIDTNESKLYAIKEVELYIEFIDFWYISFEKIHNQFQSNAINGIWQIIKDVYFSEHYINLKANVSDLSFSVRHISSVTLGVNLDAGLSPYEAGIVSINTEPFRSGDIISHCMRLDFSKDMTTLAPLASISKTLADKDRRFLTNGINNALVKVVGKTLREWERVLKECFSQINFNLFIKLLPEIRFILHSTKFINSLRSINMPVCIPTVHKKEEKYFQASGLYNPVLAASFGSTVLQSVIVSNDITFDHFGELYILTGPNQGGKSVFVKSVGIAQLLFQLGLPIPAREIEISPVDYIFTHFPKSEKSEKATGRFEEECERMQNILTYVSPFSIVLMDETFSGTSSYEASVIGKEIIASLSIIGCKGIFSTHLHDLAQNAYAINSVAGTISKVDNLIATMDNGKRTYIITRGRPDGRSYAQDIAEKYGLSVDHILKMNSTFCKNNIESHHNGSEKQE